MLSSPRIRCRKEVTDMNEHSENRDGVILVSSTHAFFLYAQAAFFQRDVNLTKYSRRDIQACNELRVAYHNIYESAVEAVIEIFSDSVDTALGLWMDEQEGSPDKWAKDIFIQRPSFEIPDRLDGLFQKLTEETADIVDRHFQNIQKEAGFFPVLFRGLDLRGYRKDWEGVFLELVTEVVVGRITMMKLDKKLTDRSRKADRFLETITDVFQRSDLECRRIRERITVPLKGVKPFCRFSAAVSTNVWAWVSAIEEYDDDDF